MYVCMYVCMYVYIVVNNAAPCASSSAAWHVHVVELAQHDDHDDLLALVVELPQLEDLLALAVEAALPVCVWLKLSYV